MFKKERDIAERSKTLLKNKEVRTLKSEILKKFPNVQEEELNAVIPNKADITVTKLANKTLLYSISGVTLVFDIESRNNLCPALPFLWRFPQALPTFVIHSPVSEFVLRGADLMVPGICKSKIAELVACGVKEGDKVAIRVMGNPLPFAVGECLVGGAALGSGKLKGRAVTVYHVYGDLISTVNAVPNGGFGPSRIYPLEGFAEPGAADEQSDASDDEDSDSDASEEAAGGEAEEDAGDVGCEEGADVEAETAAEVMDGAEELVSDLQRTSINHDDMKQDYTNENGNNAVDPGALGSHAEDAEEGPGTADSTAVPTEIVDAQLLQAVLLATKYVLKDKQLPMLVSTYWALLQR
jgi:translation initiation factor 2D